MTDETVRVVRIEAPHGTDGRTYGGDPNLVHIPDHHRADVGEAIASQLESTMRLLAMEHQNIPFRSDIPLCPGCYMIAAFDMLVTLAERSGQPVKELGHSMAALFTKLAENGKYEVTEEMIVRP